MTACFKRLKSNETRSPFNYFPLLLKREIHTFRNFKIYKKKNVNLLLLLIYYFKKHNMVKHYEMTKMNLEMNENTNQKIDRSR